MARRRLRPVRLAGRAPGGRTGRRLGRARRARQPRRAADPAATTWQRLRRRRGGGDARARLPLPAQLALGRSARGIQDRLAEFAARGDTETEAGLAALLQQTALELLREKDAVRYLGAEARGPMSLTNAETAMNAMALAERGRFQVERVRARRRARRRARTRRPRRAKKRSSWWWSRWWRRPATPLASSAPELARPRSGGALLSELGGVSPDAHPGAGGGLDTGRSQ